MTQRVRILVLGLLVGLPLFILALLGAVRDLRDRQQVVADDQVALARAAALAADGFLQSDEAALRALVALPQVRDFGSDPDAAQRAMQPVFEAFPNLETLGLIGPDGWNVRSLVRQGQVAPRSLFVGDRPYVQQALARDAVVLSSAVLSRLRPGVPVVAAALPVPPSDTGEGGGVMIGTVALARLREAMLSALPEARLGLVLLDAEGQVLIAPDVEPNAARELTSLRGHPAVDDVLAGRSGSWTGMPPNANREMIVGYAPVPEANLAVLVSQPTAVAFGPARNAAMLGVGTLGVALALSLGAAWWLATRLARSHTALEHARQAAERGRDRAAFLAEAGGKLASSLDYESTLQAVARAAVPALADWCVVDLLHTGATDLRRLVVAHADPNRRHLAQRLREQFPFDLERDAAVQRVVQSGEPLLISEITDEQMQAAAHSESHLAVLRETGPASVIIAPLRGREGVLGTMSFVYAESGRAYGPEDVELARSLADRAGLAVENARLFAEVQAAVRTRDEFLAAASHDLKNPLAAVKVQAQLLARRALQRESVQSADVVAATERIDRVVTRATEQLDELLEVARLQLGERIELDRVPVDLVQLARDVMAEHSGTERHRVVLDTAYPSLVGRWDARRLHRVVGNLLSNAIKYSPAGGTISISIGKEEIDGSPYAVLSIADQGIGIPERDLPYLFQRFRRGSNVVGRIAGTGIGLASSRQMLESHGGTLDIHSREGHGTRAVVRLPMAGAAAPEQALVV